MDGSKGHRGQWSSSDWEFEGQSERRASGSRAAPCNDFTPQKRSRAAERSERCTAFPGSRAQRRTAARPRLHGKPDHYPTGAGVAADPEEGREPAALSAPRAAGRALASVTRLVREHLQSSPLRRRFVSGATWSALGATVSCGCYVLSMIFVARGLGMEEFGALGVIQSTVAMLQVLAGLGMGLTASRYVAELRRTDPARAGRIVGLTLAVTALVALGIVGLMLILSPWLAGGPLNAPRLVRPLRISAGLVLFGTMQAAQLGILSGIEAFRSQARAQMVGPILSVPLVLGGLKLGGLEGAVGGLVIGAAAGFGALGWTVRRELRSAGVPLSYRKCAVEWKAIRDFGLPSLLAGLLVAPVNWICAAMLVNRPGGYGEMGIFSAASQWRLAALHFPATLGQVLVPMLSERLGAQDASSQRKLLMAGTAVNAATSLAVVLPVCALSPLIMAAYGAGFSGAWPTLVVSMIAALLTAVQSPVGTMIAAAGRMWIGFWMNLGWGVVTVALSALAVQRGAFGLALAQVGGYLAHGAWTAWFAWRISRNGSRVAARSPSR